MRQLLWFALAGWLTVATIFANIWLAWDNPTGFISFWKCERTAVDGVQICKRRDKW